MVQRYVHDPTSWDALPVAEQERVVGRTKLNDIELAEFGIGRDEVLDRPVAQ